MAGNSFADNFDGTTLNTQLWRKPLWENGVPNNVTVGDGLLKCLVDKPKTSASIASNIQYGYGTYITRMKFPGTDQNLRGAFWLKDGTYGEEEIDIEYYGYMPSSIDLTIYIGPGEIQLATKRIDLGRNLAFDFHEWKIEYFPGKIIYYLDGVEIWRFADPKVPTRPMLIRIKADNPSWRPDSISPGYTLSDYVTFYDYVPVKCSITITSPSTGLIYSKGDHRAIRWTSTGNVGTNVKIQLLRSGNIIKTISNNTVNDGSFSWTVPSVLRSNDYQIKMTSMTNSLCTCVSSTFTIR